MQLPVMPTPHKPVHRLLLDYDGDHGLRDRRVTDLVEIGDIRMGLRTAATALSSRSEPSHSLGPLWCSSTTTPSPKPTGPGWWRARLHARQRHRHGRAGSFPPVHEQLTYPDFLAFTVQGYGTPHLHRTVHEYFENARHGRRPSTSGRRSCGLSDPAPVIGVRRDYDPHAARRIELAQGSAAVSSSRPRPASCCSCRWRSRRS